MCYAYKNDRWISQPPILTYPYFYHQQQSLNGIYTRYVSHYVVHPGKTTLLMRKLGVRSLQAGIVIIENCCTVVLLYLENSLFAVHINYTFHYTAFTEAFKSIPNIILLPTSTMTIFQEFMHFTIHTNFHTIYWPTH